MGGGSEIMVGCGWSRVAGVKLWLVVGGSGELMPGRGWSWVVEAKLYLVVGGRGWSWLVALFSNTQLNYICCHYKSSHKASGLYDKRKNTSFDPFKKINK